MWIAEYDTHGMDFPTCVHVTKTTNTMTHGDTYVPIGEGMAVRVERDCLRAENARLRELVGERADDVRALVELEAENAKLRELVEMMYGCAKGPDCDDCKRLNDGYACAYIMRELGVEVDGG